MLVFIETTARTLILAIFYLVACGWGVFRFDPCPLKTLRCVRFISAFFIAHCLLFLSVGLGVFHRLVRLLLVVAYAIIALFSYFSS